MLLDPLNLSRPILKPILQKPKTASKIVADAIDAAWYLPDSDLAAALLAGILNIADRSDDPGTLKANLMTALRKAQLAGGDGPAYVIRRGVR